MNFGFRSEVGYDADKDVTFLRTNSPDFEAQLIFPAARGSKEDKEIRALLQDQGIVDFAAVNAAVNLPAVDKYDMSFGMVGNKEDDDMVLTPEYYKHLVLFGKDTSGALNLIRFWLLWARVNKVEVISIGNPEDLYGFAKQMNADGTLHVFDEEEFLQDQYEALPFTQDAHGPKILILVGSDYHAETLEDRLFLKDVQNDAKKGGQEIFSLIHPHAYHLQTKDTPFTGSDGYANNVSFAIIGDVNEVVAEKVGRDVPTRNARGIAWFSRGGEEAKRVKTYVVPRAFIEQGD